MAKISKYDFKFQFVGYGYYKVTYTSPITSKSWTRTINDMMMIDAVKNTEYPKIKDMEWLKKLVKNNW